MLWIWGDQQTRHLTAEAAVTKGTLTGLLMGEDLVSASLTEREKDQLASLQRKIIRSVDES